MLHRRPAKGECGAVRADVFEDRLPPLLLHGDAKAATDTTKIWTDIKAIRAESDDIEKDIDKFDTVSEAEAFTWSFQE